METYKKRQKALARKEKQEKKAARRMERRAEKARAHDKVEDAHLQDGPNTPSA